MRKGKILKVRLGHEANGGAGEAFGLTLLCCYVVVPLYLVLACITAFVQARAARRTSEAAGDGPAGERDHVGRSAPARASLGKLGSPYLLGPLVLGLVPAAVVVVFAGGAGILRGEHLAFLLVLVISFSFSIAVGYLTARRLRHLVVVLVPVCFLAGVYTMSWLIHLLD